MRSALLITALTVVALLALEGAALGQAGQTPPYTYTPPLQAPPMLYQNRNYGMVAPAPFGGFYNVLSGNAAPQRNGKQPLTPFNTPGQPIVTP
ncbi:MAG TPA: hypothetical protein VGC16_08690 [Rhizomicrobium sp.]